MSGEAERRPACVLDPASLDAKTGASLYPEAFRAAVAGRTRRRLGAALGLTGFGVNLTRLEPGASSALRHWHTREDEFVFIVEGELVLRTDAGDTPLKAGMCAGFKAGDPDGHCLINLSDRPAVYLEMGNRAEGDEAHYPDDDLWYRDKSFYHRDGRPW
jgi:uncharacterized cupin superfamily protein